MIIVDKMHGNRSLQSVAKNPQQSQIDDSDSTPALLDFHTNITLGMGQLCAPMVKTSISTTEDNF